MHGIPLIAWIGFLPDFHVCIFYLAMVMAKWIRRDSPMLRDQLIKGAQELRSILSISEIVGKNAKFVKTADSIHRFEAVRMVYPML